MSKTSQNTRGQLKPFPRAVVHKQILDAAETQPGASISELAENVSGASTTLVEQVLEEYGDPASKGNQAKSGDDVDSQPKSGDREDSSKTATGSMKVADPSDTSDETDYPLDGSETDTDNDNTVLEPNDVSLDSKQSNAREPSAESDEKTNREEGVQRAEGGDNKTTEIDPSTLSEKQRETLRVIYERPTASQRELADYFDVAAATINQRVNTIDGFEWDRRTELVKALFEDTDGLGEGYPKTSSNTDLAVQVERLSSHIEHLEMTLQDVNSGLTTSIEDPELLHKIVNACLDADFISEDEERRILEQMLLSS